MKPRKLPFVVIAAAAFLGALVSNASARNLSATHQNLAVSFRSVTFTMPFGETVCAISLSGSFHGRTIAKTAGLLTGFVNRFTLGACSAGAVTILAETLPWHITYRNFTGTLPNITSIGVDAINAAFRLGEPGGVTCLARSTAARPIVLTAIPERGVLTTATVGGSVPTGAECFGVTGTFSSDRGPITTAAGSTTRITVTLI